MYLRDKITKEDFIQKYNSMSNTELAKKLRVSRQTIVYMAKKYGLEQKHKGGAKPIKVIKIEKEELKRLYETMTTKDLAKKFGVSITTLLRNVKLTGAKMKRPGCNKVKKIVVEG